MVDVVFFFLPALITPVAVIFITPVDRIFRMIVLMEDIVRFDEPPA